MLDKHFMPDDVNKTCPGSKKWVTCTPAEVAANKKVCPDCGRKVGVTFRGGGKGEVVSHE